jgi:hypothetical protein
MRQEIHSRVSIKARKETTTLYTFGVFLLRSFIDSRVSKKYACLAAVSAVCSLFANASFPFLLEQSLFFEHPSFWILIKLKNSYTRPLKA